MYTPNHFLYWCADRFRAIIPGFVTDRTEAGPDTAPSFFISCELFLCLQFLTPPLPATSVPSSAPRLY